MQQRGTTGQHLAEGLSQGRGSINILWTDGSLLPSPSDPWSSDPSSLGNYPLIMEKFSFRYFTEHREAEQDLMCWHRSAHSNQPYWPSKMNFPIFFKMVQNDVTLYLIRKLWRHIMGPSVSLFVHLKNRPESEYVIWSQASKNTPEEKGARAREFTTVLPVLTTVEHQPTPSTHSLHLICVSQGAKKNEANKICTT